MYTSCAIIPTAFVWKRSIWEYIFKLMHTKERSEERAWWVKGDTFRPFVKLNTQHNIIKITFRKPYELSSYRAVAWIGCCASTLSYQMECVAQRQWQWWHTHFSIYFMSFDILSPIVWFIALRCKHCVYFVCWFGRLLWFHAKPAHEHSTFDMKSK